MHFCGTIPFGPRGDLKARHSIGSHLVFKASANPRLRRKVHITHSIEPELKEKKRAEPARCAGRPVSRRRPPLRADGTKRRIHGPRHGGGSLDAESPCAGEVGPSASIQKVRVIS